MTKCTQLGITAIRMDKKLKNMLPIKDNGRRPWSCTLIILDTFFLKGQRHVTVNKPVISMIYIITHTWPLCSAQILVDGVNPR